MTRQVVDLMSEREKRIEDTWQDYCAARTRADETLSVEDGIAAGRAWRRWLDLFLTHEQRQALDRADNVISSGRRIG